MDCACLGFHFWGTMAVRKLYPSGVSDDEWALVAPYLTLLPECLSAIMSLFGIVSGA